MKKLTPIFLAALMIWSVVLSVIVFRAQKTANEAKEIEDARQGLSNIMDLSFRVPLIMKLAADDVLGPEQRIENIKMRSSSTGFNARGSYRNVSYVFELPESAPGEVTKEVIGRFEYYCAIMVGIDSWPIETAAGLSRLKIDVPQPNKDEKKIFLDVAIHYSPYVKERP